MAGFASGLWEWGSVHQRFTRWRRKGIWEKLLEILIDEPDYEWLMIDATHIKVHPQYIWPWMRMVCQSESLLQYVSTKKFSELYMEGVSSFWGGSYSKNEENGLVYDQFGDYNSVDVNVQFKTSTNSNQERLTINFDSTTPTDPAVEEISHTYRADTWSMTVRREVSMYNHYWGTNSAGFFSHSEYTVNDFKRTSAHEFGHVLGLGDAYAANGHTDAPVTPEIPGGEWLQDDMIRKNGDVTSNDIEMMLEAWKTNSWQTFVDDDPSAPAKSKAIKSY